MKKSAAYFLLAVAIVLMAFMAGYFLGRNAVSTPVIVSKLPTQASQGKININTATLQQLDELPGLGTTLAQRILDYRNIHGPFERLSDLTMVEGIGIDILEKISDYVTVQEDIP